MGDRLLHSLLLERGGIGAGSRVSYSALEDDRVHFRVLETGDRTVVCSNSSNEGMDTSDSDEGGEGSNETEDKLKALLEVLAAACEEYEEGDGDE